MKIAVFGSGAIGSYLGWHLTRAGGHEVTLIGRGPHLQAMQHGGLTLRAAGREETVAVRAEASGSPLPPQDVVLLCVKAHSLPAAMGQVTPLLHPDTMVVTVANGIPWWYAHRAPKPMPSPHLAGVDPAGAVWRAAGPERAIGCVPYVGVAVPEPGVVAFSAEGYNEFPIGEPSGEDTPRLRALAAVFAGAGISAPVTADIRALIWKKLLGNVTTNPISVITGATMEQMLSHEPTAALTRAVMAEVMAIAAAAGVTVDADLDERIATLRKLGDFKTSMLQDYEQGRALEVGPIVGAVREIAQQTGVAAPYLETVYLLVSAIADRHGRAIRQAA